MVNGEIKITLSIKKNVIYIRHIKFVKVYVGLEKLILVKLYKLILVKLILVKAN